VPGVTLTGKVPLRGPAVIHIGGRAAARGTLRISERGAIRGKLGGHKVSGHFAGAARLSAAAAAGGPSWEESLRRFSPFGNELLPTG
jgi:hypothetical protein